MALIEGLRDRTAAEAFGAWERRHGGDRWPDGYRQYLVAALAMAPSVLLRPFADLCFLPEHDPIPEGAPSWWPSEAAAPMPLGAVRAHIRGELWEPSEDSPWLATIPVIETIEPQLTDLTNYYGWNFAQPRETCEQFCGDVLMYEGLDLFDVHDVPDAVRDAAVREQLDMWRETTVAMSGRAFGVSEIVAFDPRNPSAWWLRNTGLVLLGGDYLSRAMENGDAVRVYPTPAAWNEAGAGAALGCCIIHPDGWRTLLDAADIIAEDVAHGEIVQAHLRAARRRLTPRLPRVLVAG